MGGGGEREDEGGEGVYEGVSASVGVAEGGTYSDGDPGEDLEHCDYLEGGL